MLGSYLTSMRSPSTTNFFPFHIGTHWTRLLACSINSLTSSLTLDGGGLVTSSLGGFFFFLEVFGAGSLSGAGKAARNRFLGGGARGAGGSGLLNTCSSPTAEEEDDDTDDWSRYRIGPTSVEDTAGEEEEQEEEERSDRKLLPGSSTLRETHRQGPRRGEADRFSSSLAVRSACGIRITLFCASPIVPRFPPPTSLSLDLNMSHQHDYFFYLL